MKSLTRIQVHKAIGTHYGMEVAGEFERLFQSHEALLKIAEDVLTMYLIDPTPKHQKWLKHVKKVIRQAKGE